MGKSSVEHQSPDAASAAAASRPSSNNGRSALKSVDTNGSAVAAHDAHHTSAPHSVSAAVASASREMFHGLFQDLGKQAMALEAILRIVCGKVDSMENWMTEMSFGMTELDLKLRNIAHNIEGTAANVDDEAANVYRWAPPPADDDSTAAARAVATVKKKLGPNKTTVRVTGMVASVIDTLSVPAEERDIAITATSTTAAASASKSKPKKSIVAAVALKKVHRKKTGHQHHDHSKATAHVDKRPMSASSDAPDPTAAVDIHTAAPASPHVVSPAAESEHIEPAPLLQTQLVADLEIENDDGGESTSRSDLDSEWSARATDAVPAAEIKDAPVAPVQAPLQATATTSESVTQAVPADLSNSVQHNNNVSHEAPPSVPPRDMLAVVESKPVQEMASQPTEPEPLAVEQAAAKSTQQQEHSSSFPLNDVANPSDIDTVAHAVEPVSSKVVSSPPTTAATLSTSTAVAISVDSAKKSAALAPLVENDLQSPIATVAAAEPLTRRASSRKPILADTDGGVVLPTQSAPTEPDAIPIETERPQSVATAAIVVPPLVADISQSDTFPGVDTGGSRDGSESEDSASSSSESDSHDDDDNEDDDNDDDDVAQTSSSKNSSGGPTASSMTRTITALKKLKKANMLTAEEVDELKQRAQNKWFKLKGHVKEKKKKDVANILLKRKKNVFTVSARIELLEEKSKEVFAAIKQLTGDLKTKVDGAATDSLRRQVHDMTASLQVLDHRLSVGATPAMDKVTQLARDVDAMRATFTQQFVVVGESVDAATQQVAAAASEQRSQLELLRDEFAQQLAALRAESEAKVRELPDYSAALESIKRAVRRKADLKQLKELEARLLGRDNNSEDCLVRCLSCHKEVAPTADADNTSDAAVDDERAAFTKKVNPGPSAGRIYRSNVPFSAQFVGAYESIPEDAMQASGDATFGESTDATALVSPGSTTKTVVVCRDEISSRANSTAPPISSILIKSSRAAMSPDRPISAPAAALKKKASYMKSKPLK